jgi:hypothetical protein
MGFLHVLLAVALTLGGVRARREEAAVERRRVGVLVVDMTIALLLCWPAVLMIFALVVRTLPRTLMSLEVLGEVAGTLELFITQRALMNLRFGVLLTPCHRPEDVILVDVDVFHRTLHGARRNIIRREDLVGGETYSLAVLVTDKLSWLPIVTHPTKE